MPGLLDDHPGRWRVLALVSCAELLGMSLWFTASAVAPQLESLWAIGPREAAWLTVAVQLGFVAGTAGAAALNLADLVPARLYFAVSVVLAALSNAALVIAPGVFPEALVARFLTGAFLAGVYPPALKMIATWFRSARGLAIGTVVGALTVGKATPYLAHAVPSLGVHGVILIASAGGLVSAILVLAGYREGPYPFERREFSWRLVVAVMRDSPTRLAIGGYLGHMWELYAMWTWIPAFIAASMAAWGTSAAGGAGAATGAHAHPGWIEDAMAFGAIAAGGLGCLWGGWMADRIGRERLVNLAMLASGACCLLIGAFFGSSPWLLAAIAWIWGFFIVADSAQFSALVTEVAPLHAVGTALTLQTSLGFLLTMATIQIVPAIAGASGWRWAFPILALGPVLGIASIARLARLRKPAGTRAARQGSSPV